MNVWSIIDFLRPWRTIRRLRAHNDKLIHALSHPILAGMSIGADDELKIGLNGIGFDVLAGIFIGMFQKYGAKNFLECHFESPLGPILVTVRHPDGKLPSQLLDDARLEIQRLEAELAQARQS